MYVEDLGEYRYNGRFALPGVRAIGWLALGQPFPTGELSALVVEKLAWLATMKPINQMRGFHRCEFCTRAEVSIKVEGVERLLGSAEIWVPVGGELFASPDLLVHYIRDHQYLPPQPFVDAVQALDLRSWDPPRDYGLELYRQSLKQR
jgi:hypothetical protein